MMTKKNDKNEKNAREKVGENRKTEDKSSVDIIKTS